MSDESGSRLAVTQLVVLKVPDTVRVACASVPSGETHADAGRATNAAVAAAVT